MPDRPDRAYTTGSRHLAPLEHSRSEFYARVMAQDGPEWSRLRLELKNARRARALTLEAIGGLLMSKSNVSKMESGTRALTRPIMQRYAMLTGIDKFVTAFDYLVAKDEHPEASPGELPHLGAVLVSAEVEQILTIGELARVEERRAVVPKIHGVEGTSIGLHFGTYEGRRPRVRPVTAYRAEIPRQGWMDHQNYEVAVRFPKDAIEIGGEPYEFGLTYEYEMSARMFGMVPSDPLPLYSLTIELPGVDTDVYELNGVLPEAIDGIATRIKNGDPTMTKPRTFEAYSKVRRAFVDLRPARFYGFIWFPRGHVSNP